MVLKQPRNWCTRPIMAVDDILSIAKHQLMDILKTIEFNFSCLEDVDLI
jgi:hypothetical protein